MPSNTLNKSHQSTRLPVIEQTRQAILQLEQAACLLHVLSVTVKQDQNKSGHILALGALLTRLDRRSSSNPAIASGTYAQRG